MIVLENICKTYKTKKTNVNALKSVNLKIADGDIFGIIGYSGAGKSTLVRCINLLEKPDSGKVDVNGVDFLTLSGKELRKRREKIGMIFQHFNLMSRRNIFNNVAYPLKGKGLSKEQIEDKVLKLLDIVGIKEKAYVYPSQLSGGQKQRVGIARALANDPEVLLCDEATSALDPQNTGAILNLLKDINKKLNLTVVIITHQMEVIKDICNKVAVMENGEIVEEGNTLDIFSNPKADITKEFVSRTMHSDKIYDILKAEKIKDNADDKKHLNIKISYIGDNTAEAFISKISIKFEVLASILFGNIEFIQGVSFGNLIVKLTGESKKIDEAVGFLKENNIKVEVINNDELYKSINA
ncbi:MAG: ATP-binding cassette domain-containing protein [Clostridium sp.]|nr:ATP-binding cassette domain-containing protein [Clostridium sp.]